MQALGRAAQAARLGNLQEVLQGDHRIQVAAQGAHAQQPRLGTRHRGHWRHRHDFHHFAEIGYQPALADAVTDATPQVQGELPFWQLHRMGPAAPFVAPHISHTELKLDSIGFADTLSLDRKSGVEG
ncbi:hypothetical protein G6F58_013367 [Rhizopus delemar]|nr:hypothetical protein G6F58_013367 [Rhizopus delemar]